MSIPPMVVLSSPNIPPSELDRGSESSLAYGPTFFSRPRIKNQIFDAFHIVLSVFNC